MQAKELGILGKNIFGSGFDFDIEVSLTGESYVAGEETALMEAVEGKRWINLKYISWTLEVSHLILV